MPTDLSPKRQARTELHHRREMCRVGRLMYQRGYIVACEGNLSVKLDEERILTTPTRINKGMMLPDDLVIVDLEGRPLQGHLQVSSELGMHLLFYRMNAEIRAVCHGHPPTATGFAAAGLGLEPLQIAGMAANIGAVPLVPYATPGTADLSAALEPFAAHSEALLLANHGAVTCAGELLTAFSRMEALEHMAKIALSTRLIGEAQMTPARAMASLRVGPKPGGSTTEAPGGGPESRSICERDQAEEIVLKRSALNALVDQAVRKVRARR